MVNTLDRTMRNSSFDPAVHIKVTRNCIHYRPLPSPLAQLFRSLFDFLCDPHNPVAVNARKSFVRCLSLEDPSDENIIQALQPLPIVVLIQGAYQPEKALEKQLNGSQANVPETASISSSSTASSVDLREAIVLPYLFHQELVRCEEEGDVEGCRKFKMLAMTSMIHETCHYLFTKTFGYMPDPQRQDYVGNQGAWKDDDHNIALLERMDDVGTVATAELFGYAIQTISWADGDTSVVKQRLSTSSVAPVMDNANISKIIKGPVPAIDDITENTKARVDAVPEWGCHGDFMMVSRVGANGACIHGQVHVKLG